MPIRRTRLPASLRATRLRADAQAFRALIGVARHLQGPRGCPWDRAQRVDSLLPHLIDEVWEVFNAVRDHEPAAFQEELGDVLYTCVFLSLLAERDGWGTLEEMLRATTQKMVRRHPHVFGRQRARTAEEAYQQWQRVKRAEGRRRAASASHALRPLLVLMWDALRRHPRAAAALRRAVRTLPRKDARGRISGRRPTARSWRGSNRSSSPTASRGAGG